MELEQTQHNSCSLWSNNAPKTKTHVPAVSIKLLYIIHLETAIVFHFQKTAKTNNLL